MGYSAADMKEYMVGYRANRMQAAKTFLGGKCKICETTENLQFDHIDRSTKIEPVTRLLHASHKRFWTEVRKCQLLCEACHKEKCKIDGSYIGRPRVIPEHGTLSRYDRHGCRCELCRSEKVKRRRGRTGYVTCLESRRP